MRQMRYLGLVDVQARSLDAQRPRHTPKPRPWQPRGAMVHEVPLADLSHCIRTAAKRCMGRAKPATKHGREEPGRICNGGQQRAACDTRA